MKLFIFLLLALTLVFAKPSSIHPRILNGTNASPGQFPYQVSIQWNFDAFWQHFCNGAIISKTWILTSGLCAFFHFNPDSDIFRIQAGIYKLSQDTEGVQIEIAERIVHPGFDYHNSMTSNDIGLVRLASPLIFNDFIQPIKLPQQNLKISGQGVVSGWGSTVGGLDIHIPDVLQTEQYPILDINECKRISDDIWGRNNTIDIWSNLCTGPLEGGTGTCASDNGSPLVQDGVLVGIVSYAMIPCGLEGHPSVYTNVSNFISFIKGYVDDLPQ